MNNRDAIQSQPYQTGIQNKSISSTTKPIALQLMKTIVCMVILHVICVAIAAHITGGSFVLILSTFIKNGITVLCLGVTTLTTLAQSAFVAHRQQSLQANQPQNHWDKHKNTYALALTITVNAIFGFISSGVIHISFFILIPPLLTTVLTILHLVYYYKNHSSQSSRQKNLALYETALNRANIKEQIKENIDSIMSIDHYNITCPNKCEPQHPQFNKLEDIDNLIKRFEDIKSTFDPKDELEITQTMRQEIYDLIIPKDEPDITQTTRQEIYNLIISYRNDDGELSEIMSNIIYTTYKTYEKTLNLIYTKIDRIKKLTQKMVESKMRKLCAINNLIKTFKKIRSTFDSNDKLAITQTTWQKIYDLIISYRDKGGELSNSMSNIIDTTYKKALNPIYAEIDYIKNLLQTMGKSYGINNLIKTFGNIKSTFDPNDKLAITQTTRQKIYDLIISYRDKGGELSDSMSNIIDTTYKKALNPIYAEIDRIKKLPNNDSSISTSIEDLKNKFEKIRTTYDPNSNHNITRTFWWQISAINNEDKNDDQDNLKFR